ncbi:hypothetical protein CDAR_94491 [Caerostris darwini]|uniref:G-protein coupled receptors family 2 profile 1 domain-containing protein n=1 Tax=Caerostris darwini TaxID=1538125 RepID=A0AAV4SMB5_9ARAC|nr:hypothetical protein CDAR_94491 [Caerostris darwini]
MLIPLVVWACSKHYGMYCEAAWDSFLCWPPATPGETLMRPCPMLDAMGSIIGESSHPGTQFLSCVFCLNYIVNVIKYL